MFWKSIGQCLIIYHCTHHQVVITHWYSPAKSGHLNKNSRLFKLSNTVCTVRVCGSCEYCSMFSMLESGSCKQPGSPSSCLQPGTPGSCLQPGTPGNKYNPKRMAVAACTLNSCLLEVYSLELLLRGTSKYRCL